MTAIDDFGGWPALLTMLLDSRPDGATVTIADEDDIFCIHPGGPRVVGPGAIRASFELIFGNGRIDAQPERVRRLQMQGAAVHHVLERVQAMTSDGPQSAWVVATNVYMKTVQGWRLVLHHASPGSPHVARARATT